MGRSFRNTLRFALMAGCAASPAWGQECDSASACDSGGGRSAPIVVTGTRIAEAAQAELEPRISLDNAHLQNRNLTNIADALNETPGFRGSVTPDGVQNTYGQGVNFVNLYRLGSARTLTLVDRRRMVSSSVPTIFSQASPGTQVDLNAIPAILVERIDTIGIGGAPVHGSDAIAGTVNVVQRRGFSGLELSATAGITEQGDNFRHNLSAIHGTDFADGRGHLVLAGSHDRVDGVRQNARGFYRDNVADVPNIGLPGLDPSSDGRLNPGIGFDTGPGDGYPPLVLARDFAVPLLTPGGLIIGGALDRSVQFDRAGNLVPFDRGTSHGGPFATGGDGYRLGDLGQITSDLERFSTHLLAGYDLSDRVRVFADAAYFHSKANEIADQPDFNAALFSGVSGPLVFPVTNPFLTDQARGLLAASGYRAFVLSRANGDLGDPTGYAKTDQYRATLGIDGSFPLAGAAWDFGAYLGWGRTDFTDHDQQLARQAFINAINVTRASDGSIVCDAAPLFPVGGLPVADPDCRPLNLFGRGVASPDALAYVQSEVTARSRLEQWVASANIGTSPFSIFGNAARVNVGLEHREERARFIPDAFQQAGLGRSVAVAPTRGRYNVDEAFGELYLPLLSPANAAFVDSLALFARGRYTHNSANGGSFAWAAGGNFKPIPDIQLRGNFTRSFRSPSIAELHAPLAKARLTVPDLCSAGNRNSGPNPAIRARNCAAFLAAYPGATPLLASIASVPALTGGNPDLKNERADSWTIGAVVTPRMIPGLSLSVDYLDIRIDRPIAFLSLAEIASACFDNADFDAADPANGNAFCSAIGRDAAGQVPSEPTDPAVRTGYINGHRIAFSGVQAAVSYSAGGFSAAGNLFHVRRRVQNLTGASPQRLDSLIGDPEFQGQLRLRYDTARWGVGVNANYTGEQLFSRTNRGPSPSDAREIDELDAFVTFDTNLWFECLAGLTVNVAVTNLLDRHGESYFGYLIPASIDDPLGRRFSVNVTRRF